MEAPTARRGRAPRITAYERESEGVVRTLPETEAGFQSAVIDAATTFGWLVHHQRPGRNSDGSWRSQIQGDAGFPDLVLTRDGIVIFAELKSEKGRVSGDQQAWIHALGLVSVRAPEVSVHVWRPDQWHTIERTLR
jgi:hypothetical protein